jgi:hypothetical protein
LDTFKVNELWSYLLSSKQIDLFNGVNMRLYKLVTLLPFMLLMGCSATGDGGYTSAEVNKVKNTQSSRLIVKSADIELEVKDLSVASSMIEDSVSALNGYVELINQVSENKKYINVKVPSDKVDGFLHDLSGVGSVESSTFSAEDVTERMVDIKARLGNLYLLRSKYQELLKKANKVSELIQIEKELTEIQTEIDSIEGKRKSLQGQVDMSKVSIQLKREVIYGPLGYVIKGTIWVIKKLFIIN